MANPNKGGMDDRERQGGNMPHSDSDASSRKGGNRSDLDEKNRGGNRSDSDQGDNRNLNKDRMPSDRDRKDR